METILPTASRITSDRKYKHPCTAPTITSAMYFTNMHVYLWANAEREWDYGFLSPAVGMSVDGMLDFYSHHFLFIGRRTRETAPILPNDYNFVHDYRAQN